MIISIVTKDWHKGYTSHVFAIFNVTYTFGASSEHRPRHADLADLLSGDLFVIHVICMHISHCFLMI